METNQILFITASLALIVSPGPDNILVLTRGIAQGRAAALVSATGASLGVIVHSALAAVGLSALLAQSAMAYGVVKYVGAAYLIYLGVRALLGKESFVTGKKKPDSGLKSIFLQALATDVLNPKVALFFIAFLPQFTVPGAGSAALQLMTLGLTFALLTLMVFGTIGYFSGALGGWLGTRPAFANGLRWLTGSVLLGLGLRLALPERR
ncbi:MAG TPA: LysE family translocator [Rubrobacteraceae bacterium]|nr:LysE family translocator [Rubrobacteraceae bacterium]